MPKKAKKLSRSEIMKAVWAKRKLNAEFKVIADEFPGQFRETVPEDTNPVATHLENELRRRDKELIAEWKNAVSNTRPNQIFGGALLVPWSTVDAILKALDPTA